MASQPLKCPAATGYAAHADRAIPDDPGWNNGDYIHHAAVARCSGQRCSTGSPPARLAFPTSRRPPGSWPTSGSNARLAARSRPIPMTFSIRVTPRATIPRATASNAFSCAAGRSTRRTTSAIRPSRHHELSSSDQEKPALSDPRERGQPSATDYRIASCGSSRQEFLQTTPAADRGIRPALPVNQVPTCTTGWSPAGGTIAAPGRMRLPSHQRQADMPSAHARQLPIGPRTAPRRRSISNVLWCGSRGEWLAVAPITPTLAVTGASCRAATRCRRWYNDAQNANGSGCSGSWGSGRRSFIPIRS